MEAKLVCDVESLKILYECADIQHGLEDMMPGYGDSEHIIADMMHNSWMIAIIERDIVLGYILLEWTDYTKGRALVHICKFEKCDGIKAWELALPIIKKHAKFLMAQIPNERKEVIYLAKKAGFRIRNIEGGKNYLAFKKL